MSNGSPDSPLAAPAGRKKYQRAVGPRLRVLLTGVWILLAVLGANSVYLAAITFLEWWERAAGASYQNYFYQIMFLVHLALGLVFALPLLTFALLHLRNTWTRPNRRAVRAGLTLFLFILICLATGVMLMRVDGLEMLALNDQEARSIAYWAHVLTPLGCVWLYVLHRLAGPRLRWQAGLGWAAAAAVLVIGTVALHKHDPRLAHVRTPKLGEKYFQPSSARTATGNFIPANRMMNNEYCLQCHEDLYNSWYHSAHHLSSFNNPFYMFSVRETREVVLKRDGNVQASRWCAGCHDLVPFFSGAFDDPDFDMIKHPTASAGITCVGCHSIVSLEGAQTGAIGNANYTIEEPILYPFADAPTNSLRFWLNKQITKAKPAFHNRTFLKPIHKTEEFCSACHKVSIPKAVNHYKDWLRGQNSYDSFILSGPGHGARSFYYPPKTEPNCNNCHLPLVPSNDFAARHFNPTNTTQRFIHDHLFPSANSALAWARRAAAMTNGSANQPPPPSPVQAGIGYPIPAGEHPQTLEAVIKAQDDFHQNNLRIDLFGLKEGGTIDHPLIGPLRPNLPALKPGQTYLLEVVVRTLRIAHLFSQGTTDSNEIWAEASATDAEGRVLGSSGALGPHREVDPWSHFLNVYMLDKDGQRIDRRNAQNIFTPLYNNQIPPGSGAVLHYRFTVPPNQRAPIRLEAKVNYRKFDTIYFNYVYAQGWTNGQPFQLANELPIHVLAKDVLTLPVEGGDPLPAATNAPASPIPAWQRWNDYGIGLLNKGDRGSEKGELIQAADAFAQVEKLGRADGPLNQARVFFKEGRLEDAVQALQRAADTNRFQPPAQRWTLAWLNGLVNKQNGYLDAAIRELTSVLDDHYPELTTRGLDFSRDYEVINELGQTLFERAKMERADPTRRAEFLRQAVRRFEQTLTVDSENVAAHHNLALLFAQLGDRARAEKHRLLHEKYRPDDNARDRAIAIARRANPAADHAAQAIVIYDLQRPGAFPPKPASPTGPSTASSR